MRSSVHPPCGAKQRIKFAGSGLKARNSLELVAPTIGVDRGAALSGRAWGYTACLSDDKS